MPDRHVCRIASMDEMGQKWAYEIGRDTADRKSRALCTHYGSTRRTRSIP